MVEKIQRYVALLFSLALLALTFWPVQSGQKSYRAASWNVATSYLDKTPAAAIFGTTMLSFEPWVRFSEYVAVCRPIGEPPVRDRLCDQLPGDFNAVSFIPQNESSLGERAKRLQPLLQQYWAVAKVKPVRDGEERGINGERRTDISLGLEAQIADELVQWFQEVRQRKHFQGILAHAALALLAILVIVLRRDVGRFIFPAHIILKGGVATANATAKAAKSLHDKV